jgi:hypothetical protein
MFTLLAHYRRPSTRAPFRHRSRLVLLTCVALLGACELRADQTEGSGTPHEETRAIEAATRVAVHGEGLLVLAQGSDTALRIRADDNIVPLLRSEVVGGVLTLGPEDGVNVDPVTPIVYRLTIPRIDAVETSGATRAEIGRVESPRFSLRTSGASHAEAESIDADRVVVESSGTSSIEATLESSVANIALSGSSRIALRGGVDEQEVEASGASDYRASALRSHRAEVRASGSSSAALFADESIRVDGSGASSVRYQGGGRLSRSLSGVASVEAE